ncbi:MAG: Rrf2 family transcriptional regulator, partial [Planctomycetota bacterium]
AALIEAVEGPVRFVRCSSPSQERRCNLTARCFIRSAVLKVHLRLREFLEGVTVADIALDEKTTAAVEAKLAQ